MASTRYALIIMTGRDLYRTQVTLVLASLVALLACSVHSLFIAESRAYVCIDLAIIAFSILGITYADNLAVKISGFVTRTQPSERVPPTTSA